MTEVWLQANRRILFMAMIPASLLGAVGWIVRTSSAGLVASALAWLVLFASIMLLVGLALQLARPRIAYRDRHVLFFLRAGAPVAVPVKVVEAFFLGQGPADLPGAGRRKAETVNLVARLSQREPRWEHVDIKPALGRWCDSYVTIRGTWCEPLTGELLRRLNHRLAEVSRAQPTETEGHVTE